MGGLLFIYFYFFQITDEAENNLLDRLCLITFHIMMQFAFHTRFGIQLKCMQTFRQMFCPSISSVSSSVCLISCSSWFESESPLLLDDGPVVVFYFASFFQTSRSLISLFLFCHCVSTCCPCMFGCVLIMATRPCQQKVN